MLFESTCLDLMDLCIAGLSYLWEQAKYDPVKRQLTCHISLKNPQTSQVQLSLCSIHSQDDHSCGGHTMMLHNDVCFFSGRFFSGLLKLPVSVCMASPC